VKKGNTSKYRLPEEGQETSSLYSLKKNKSIKERYRNRGIRCNEFACKKGAKGGGRVLLLQNKTGETVTGCGGEKNHSRGKKGSRWGGLIAKGPNVKLGKEGPAGIGRGAEAVNPCRKKGKKGN